MSSVSLTHKLKNHLFAISALIILSRSTDVSAINTVEFEFDPYYTNAGYFISLTEEEIPKITDAKEGYLYQHMLHSILSKPRFFLIEASVNPLPIVGVHLKRHHTDFYNKSQVNDDLNIIQALTEGFEEPYALSLFLGSVVQFIRPGESEDISNKGYTGYLLSVGDKHIVRNIQVDDNWYEFEAKIKGDQEFKNKSLSWSLRTGIKIHSNENIADVIHFGLRRNHLDTALTKPSFIDNSDIEYKIKFDKDTFKLVEQELFINKKWHIGFSEKSVFSFGVGFILENGKYSGALSTNASDFRLIFRPNLNF